MSIALAASLLFALVGRWIIWASHAAVPTKELLLLMCVWVLISTFMNNTATIPVAKGETRSLAIVGLTAAAANLALPIYWVQRIGAPGVILGTIISYLVLLVGPVAWACARLLRGQR